jgi:hypothetical protein
MPMLIPEVSSRKIRITNPVENGSPFTSRKRALQFVQAGRAVFVGKNQIRFIETDLRNQAATARAAIGYVLSERMLTQKELRNIPFVNPRKAYRQAMRTSSGKERPKGGKESLQ